jgi:hypothetical protein
VNIIRKGQVRWLAKDDIAGQIAFVALAAPLQILPTVQRRNEVPSSTAKKAGILARSGKEAV